MFNYVMVLGSVIIGLAITHLLQGIAGMVQHPGRQKLYWVHLIWVGAIFLRILFWWWFEFRLSETGQWTFWLYLFVLAYAFVNYLTCALLLPRDLAGYSGFKDYFYSRKNWFFGINLVGIGFDVVDSLAKGIDHFRALGPSYPILMTVLAAVSVIGMMTRNERVQGAIAITTLAYLLIYPVTNFNTVQ